MERLLSSSSPTPLKTHLIPSPFLARLARVDSSKLSFRPELRRFSSLSCKSENSSPSSIQPYSSSSLSTPSNNLPAALSSSPDASSNGSVPEPQNLKQISIGAFQKSKALTAGTYIMLSALVMILIQPIFAPAAFATFQTAAKTGAPAAAAAVGGRLIQTELLSSAWTGFFAGCLHTLSGPDHLAALAPLSIGRTRMESAAVGALWGCGHDAGQVIFGLIFLLLKDRLHIEVIRTWGTRVVGLTLLVIGAMGIREASEVPAPCVALESGECDVSVYEALENPTIGKKKIGFATFATGIIHGLQPDALMMVLPALALPSRLAGAAFLIMFLVGTVVAMGSYTVFIGSCSQALKDRVPRITEKLTWASSIVAIALGFAILISQLFGYSLY
ncbi:high-affinity nickel-transport family protein [Parasponia andersonii]|uniref:High-affinity nickel-transport family protein n=1 Tax=Parasponia andersonii TaxID=3476 RepID=A0A2P5A7H7_PARAD|nr:high-affinity nickel-transport family protein [Parasponia andersonii]